VTIPKWTASGDLFEGCNCNLICPCHIAFRQNSTNGNCDGAWGIHVEKGIYGSIDISGLNAMVIAHSPGPSMFDGNWETVIYIDDQSNTNQEDALKSILSGSGGGPWSKLARFYANSSPIAIEKTSFNYTKTQKTRALSAGESANLLVEALTSADDQNVTLSNLFNVIHGPLHTVGKSNLDIESHGLQWSNRGKHGLFSQFEWSGP